MIQLLHLFQWKQFLLDMVRSLDITRRNGRKSNLVTHLLLTMILHLLRLLHASKTGSQLFLEDCLMVLEQEQPS